MVLLNSSWKGAEACISADVHAKPGGDIILGKSPQCEVGLLTQKTFGGGVDRFGSGLHVQLTTLVICPSTF